MLVFTWHRLKTYCMILLYQLLHVFRDLVAGSAHDAQNSMRNGKEVLLQILIREDVLCPF